MSRPYDLTDQSERDIEEIYSYSKAEFGAEQAQKYVLAFDKALLKLADNPELGRKRNEIRRGIRSMAQGSHVIFYPEYAVGFLLRPEIAVAACASPVFPSAE